MIRVAAFLGSLWLLVRLGPLGWFLLTLGAVALALAVIMFLPFVIAGLAIAGVWRLSRLLHLRYGWPR